MRNMSFALTERQFMDGTKSQTRRLGWKRVRVGELIQGVRKGQGLKRGEKVVKLRVIRVLEKRREPLDAITPADVVDEGFPEMTPAQFVEMFCRYNGCKPSTRVTRIKYAYEDR